MFDSLNTVRVTASAECLRQLESELGALFPGRTVLIRQLVLALLCREHVLIFGRYGAAKSDVVSALFGAITGSTQFRIALTKSMTESHAVGNPDFKVLKETGVMHHRTDEGLFVAHLAELDEFFDANDILLRAFLRILNERQFLRGKQCVELPLHTAVAATNADPRKKRESNEQYDAIIDRFLFIAPVAYLADKKERVVMYRKHLRGGKPTTTITCDDVKFLSGVVKERVIDVSDEVLGLYDDVLTDFLANDPAQKNLVMSDRRRCKMLAVMQAAAILEGRIELEPHDILAVAYALDPGGKTGQETVDAFKARCQPKIEKFLKERQPDVVLLQRTLLETMRSQLSVTVPKDAEGLLRVRRELLDLQKKFNDSVKAPLTENALLHTQVKTAIEKKLAEVVVAVDGGAK